MTITFRRIAVNVCASIAACLGAHSLQVGSLTAAASRAETWVGVGICVAANLAGLFQSAAAAEAPETAPRAHIKAA